MSQRHSPDWHILVMAKAPVAGRVKTRLCPHLSPEEAAAVAEAALADTLAAVVRSAVSRRIIALEGAPGPWLPPGFIVVPQRRGGFNQRLAGAWADAEGPGLQIGMDTPQLRAPDLDAALGRLAGPGVTAALGPAVDGGWWALGLARPFDPAKPIFAGVPMSQVTTGDAQLAALRRFGHRVALLEPRRDVDTSADARAVATLVPGSVFAETWWRLTARRAA